MVRSIDAIVSRSTLRDVMNRLRKIRQKCGAQEQDGEDKEGSGDPFRDKILNFQRMAKDAREMIQERNEEAQKGHLPSSEIAQRSHDVNVAMRDLKAEVTAIKQLAEAAVQDVARTNRKIAKQGEKVSEKRLEKLKLRERVAKERERAYQSCQQVIEDLTELNQQRYMSAKEAKQLKDASPADRRKAGQNAQLRQTLAQRLRSQRKRQAEGAGDDGDGAGAKRLEEDPETAQHMKDLADKQKKQDAALDRIALGLQHITESAIAIGNELDAQDKMLRDTEDKMDKATKDLKAINKGLTGLLKAQSPMNVIINVSCFLLILGLTGFFLSEFGAI